jgi:hypothetical protein
MKDTALKALMDQLKGVWEGSELPVLLPGKALQPGGGLRAGDFLLFVSTPPPSPMSKTLPSAIMMHVVKGRTGADGQFVVRPDKLLDALDDLASDLPKGITRIQKGGE